MTQNGTAVTQNGEIRSCLEHFTWIEFRAANFCYSYGKASAIQGAAIGHAVTCPTESFVRIICCRHGAFHITTDQSDASIKIDVAANTHNICFFPANTPTITEYDLTQPQEILAIDLELDTFQRYFPLHHPAFAALNEWKDRGELAALNRSSLPLNPEMNLLIQAIVRCRRPQFSKPYYLKAKIIELMLLQAEQQWESTYLHTHTLRDDELQRIYEVRDILHQEPANGHTLLSLAHRVGTNDATLKKQFKQVFGTTVFHYLTDLRMQLAREILLEEREKIAVVAQRVGYKHATHFTAAFKKHFGYLPTQIKA